jgi:hypothetical protein
MLLYIVRPYALCLHFRSNTWKMYPQRNNSGTLARIWHLTFVNGLSDAELSGGQWPMHDRSVWRPSGLVMMSSRRVRPRATAAGREFPIWGFPTGDSPSKYFRAGTHVGLHAECPLLLLDFDKNSNTSSNFSRSPQYTILRKSVQLFSCCYMGTDRRTQWF